MTTPVQNIDFQILKLFLTDRNYFVKYFEIVKFDDVLLNNILDQIKLFYTHSKNNYIDNSSMKSILYNIYNDIIYSSIIDNIYNISIDEEFIKEFFNHLYNKYLGTRLSSAITAKFASQDFSTLDDLRDLLINDEKADSDEEFASLALSPHLEEESGYEWPLGPLNDHLGKLPGSTTGLVFAPVETGKTAFLIQTSMNFRLQGARGLHLNNEDPLGKLLERYYLAHFGPRLREKKIEKPLEAIHKNWKACEQQFIDFHKENLFIKDTAECSVYRVDFLIRQTKADYVIIDQVDPMTNDIDPGSLELLYKNVRKLGKKHKTRIIEATQSVGGIEGYLTLADMHNSRVGKQAALDYAIGIGATSGLPLVRFISIPKNKLKGSHFQFQTGFNPQYIMYQ